MNRKEVNSPPLVSYELCENIGIIRINNPPVNAMSQAVRQGIQKWIIEAQNDSSKAILILCDGRTFIAGADIKEFGKTRLSPFLSEVLETIEESRKIVIAAIHGTALGGGFELALACHYRCAVISAKVGLPEVKLGLLPGAGGTQRTPRLAGVDAALKLVTSGNPISATRGRELQLIDNVFEGDLTVGAIGYAKQLVAKQVPFKRIRDINIDPKKTQTEIFDDTRKNLAKRARGQIAPQHIVSCIEAAVNLPFDEGLAYERELFMTCLNSSESAAMRHLFFAERNAVKIDGIAGDISSRQVKSVGIIGGGTMGGGIAMNFANAGIPVTLIEIDTAAVTQGLDIIKKNYNATVSKGKLSEEQMQHCLSLIQGTTSYKNLSNVDMVIEAVFENLRLKKEIFTKLDQYCKPEAILATNTSYQDIDQIALATHRPGDVIGTHFFSPANVMKLLEIVRGSKTSNEVITTCMKLAKTIKKVPVLSGNCYGFIGNRMLQPYFREAQLCLIEGSDPEQIDRVMEAFGMAMGPLAVGDLAGLDVGYKAREILPEAEKGNPRSYAVTDVLVEQGRKGQKTMAGYYRYDPNTRARINDPMVMEIVEQQAALHNVQRRKIKDDEILNRLLFGMINEGAKILEQGIAQRSSDIDVVYVNGYGFPVVKGGPMFYADTLGLKKVYQTICKFRKRYGETHWTPAPLLTQLAQDGATFGKWKK